MARATLIAQGDGVNAAHATLLELRRLVLIGQLDQAERRLGDLDGAPLRPGDTIEYTITITNEGHDTVQLLSRHWIITDGSGHVEEVKGPGVVGQQPVLEPGESFTYTSGCPLGTPFGKMEGTYQMVTRTGEVFEAAIAPFTLSEPYTVH